MINCVNVRKKFGRKMVLDELNLQIDEPKLVGLVGRNGVGKSTLMSLLAGLEKPTKGKVEVLEQVAFDNLYVSVNSIYIHPNMTFPANLSLRELCQMGAQFYMHWDQALSEKLFAYFDIPLHQTFQQLSTGMQSMFATIFGLATRAAVTLLDEPVNGIDEGLRKDMYRAILKEYIAYPRLIIISSHLLDELEHLLEEIVILHQGKVLVHDNIDDFASSHMIWEGELSRMLAAYPDALILERSPFGGDRVLVPSHIKGDFQQQAISAKDLYLYLTAEKKGSIDDVFSNDEQ